MKWFVTQAKRLRQHGFAARFKALIKKVARLITRQGIAFLKSHPRLRFLFVSLAKKLGVFETLRSIYLSSDHLRQVPYMLNKLDPLVPITAQHLSPRARRIYTEIDTAIAKRQKV